jgi:hypothetical protein
MKRGLTLGPALLGLVTNAAVAAPNCDFPLYVKIHAFAIRHRMVTRPLPQMVLDVVTCILT